MENKYVVVARTEVAEADPTVLSEQQVEIHGFSGTIPATTLFALAPKQFLVLRVDHTLWFDLCKYASSFQKQQTARVNTIVLERSQLLGLIDTQALTLVISNQELELALDQVNAFEKRYQALPDTLRYHSPAPTVNSNKPAAPGRFELLTNDQVAWLTEQYLNLCTDNRFWLDRHGNIQLIACLDGTPAYFYPSYGDAEAIEAGHHKTDVIVADIWGHLHNCGETNKLPNEIIINQIICQGAANGSTEVTGSHWYVCSVRLSGLNAEKIHRLHDLITPEKYPVLKQHQIAEMLEQGYFNHLYQTCTMSYLNSADNQTSATLAPEIRDSLQCAEKTVCCDIPVANQFVIGSLLQKGVICGDLAAQNAVCFTFYGYSPAQSQYVTRDQHINWLAKMQPIRCNEVLWHNNLQNDFTEMLAIVDQLLTLESSQDPSEAITIIEAIRSKITQWLTLQAETHYQRNNTFWASLAVLSHKKRSEQLHCWVALKSLIPSTMVKLTPTSIQELELQYPQLFFGKNTNNKMLFDSIQFIEGIISRNIQRLHPAAATLRSAL